MAVDKVPGFYKHKMFENQTFTTNKICMPFIYYVIIFFLTSRLQVQITAKTHTM